MFKRRRVRKFNWQINASAAGKLLGYFGTARATEALAETWRLNLKRMPRFGVTPSVENLGQTVEETTRAVLETPAFKEKVEQGISREVSQTTVVHELERAAVRDVQVAVAKEVVAVLKATKTTMRTYPTKKAGVRRAAINSYFIVDEKVYHKTSSRAGTLSTLEEADSRGYILPVIMQERQKAVVQAKQQTQVKKTVARNMEKTATKVINTTRGQVRELTDLQRIRQKYPALAAGNDRAYFLNIAGGGFVIGKMDGHHDDCIFELKHRQSRLFYQFRRYEQVQCMIYMKMLRVSRLKLIETFCKEQCEHDMKEEDGQHFVKSEGGEWITGLVWHDICQGLEEVVQNLNRAEADPKFRQTLIDALY